MFFHQHVLVPILLNLDKIYCVFAIFYYILYGIHLTKLRLKEIERQKEDAKIPRIYVHSHKRKDHKNRTYLVKGYYRRKTR